MSKMYYREGMAALGAEELIATGAGFHVLRHGESVVVNVHGASGKKTVASKEAMLGHIAEVVRGCDPVPVSVTVTGDFNIDFSERGNALATVESLVRPLADDSQTVPSVQVVVPQGVLKTRSADWRFNDQSCVSGKSGEVLSQTMLAVTFDMRTRQSLADAASSVQESLEQQYAAHGRPLIHNPLEGKQDHSPVVCGGVLMMNAENLRMAGAGPLVKFSGGRYPGSVDCKKWETLRAFCCGYFAGYKSVLVGERRTVDLTVKERAKLVAEVLRYVANHSLFAELRGIWSDADSLLGVLQKHMTKYFVTHKNYASYLDSSKFAVLMVQSFMSGQVAGGFEFPGMEDCISQHGYRGFVEKIQQAKVRAMAGQICQYLVDLPAGQQPLVAFCEMDEQGRSDPDGLQRALFASLREQCGPIIDGFAIDPQGAKALAVTLSQRLVGSGDSSKSSQQQCRETPPLLSSVALISSGDTTTCCEDQQQQQLSGNSSLGS